MELSFVNVGYGEAIVAREGEHVIVIDGGPGRDDVYEVPGTLRLAEYLRRKGIRRVELAIVTHIHEDHIAGMVQLAEEVEIGELWCNVLPAGDVGAMLERVRPRVETLSERLYYGAWSNYKRLMELAKIRNIRTKAAFEDGKTYRFGEMSLRLFGMGAEEQRRVQAALEQMLATEDIDELMEQFHRNDAACNATSLAMKVEGSGLRALLTGDKVDGWEALRERYDLSAEVLKITHHGQRNGMAQAMLEGADPSVIVICADRDRTFNSANAEVIGRAEQYMSERKRFPQIFITGRLHVGEGYGSALELSADASGECTKIRSKIYEIS